MLQHFPRRLPFLAYVLVLALPGCPSPHTKSRAPASPALRPDAGIGGDCASQDDCPVGYECLDRRCVKSHADGGTEDETEEQANGIGQSGVPVALGTTGHR